MDGWKFTPHPPKIEYLNPVTPIERLVWFRWERMEAAHKLYLKTNYRNQSEWEIGMRAFSEAVASYNDTADRYGVHAFQVVSQYEISP